MTDHATDSGVSDGSSTTGSSSVCASESASGAAASVSLPDVLSDVITGLENLDLKLNITKAQGHPRRIRDSGHGYFKHSQNGSYPGNPISSGYEDDMRMIKQAMLTYFRDLGGNPDSIRQNKIAREQLNELCHIYYLSKYTNNTYGYATNALVSMILANNNENPTASGNQMSPTTASGSNDIYYATYDIPIPENPECNLIGRVLGPRGMSVRELESRFRCRIFVRGRGSIRNPEKAERLMNKSGWEHLTDPLHVHIQVQGFNKQEVESRIAEIQSFIDRLLHPQGFDAFKRRQLISLAFMNGTFRPPAQLKHLHFNGIPVPSPFRCRDFNTGEINQSVPS